MREDIKRLLEQAKAASQKPAEQEEQTDFGKNIQTKPVTKAKTKVIGGK